MTATRLDITIEQGADYGSFFTILGPTGAALDLTGYSAYMQIKLAAGYPYPILSLTSLNGGLLIDATGKVTPVIPASVSAAINAGRYLYDLKLIGPTGGRMRAFEGAAYVSAEVTDEDDFTPPPTLMPALLLENGGSLLLENGGRLLLDAGVIPASGAILIENGGYLLLEGGGRLLMDAGSAPATSALLLETGGYLLNETGGKLFLENQ